MIRQKAKIEDFYTISRNYEHFLWNFITYDSIMHIRPYFEIENPRHPNPLKSILQFIDVPYFESEIEESYDFLVNLGNPYNTAIFSQGSWNPVMLSFNRGRIVGNTYSPRCYCVEGILDLIMNLNPKFVLNSNT